MEIKIVVDTSVFVSALIGAKGPSRELIRRCLKREYQSLMGNALFSEYESVINREEVIAKCPLTKAEIYTLVASFMTVSQWISIYYLWRPNLKDEADNHLIELAVAGNAQIIATIEEGRRQEAEGRRIDCRGILTRLQSKTAKLRFSGGLKPKYSEGNRAAQPTTQPSASCPLPSAFRAKRDNIRDFQNSQLLFPNLSILKPEEIIRS